MAQEKRAVKPPPSAQLNYSIRADVHGLVLDGSGQIDWALREGQYQLLFETRTALTGVLLSEKSEGGLDRYGLAPNSYSTRRFRKEALAISFDRTAGQINFAGNGAPHMIKGGEQDRVSVLWELLSIARAKPDSFTQGSSWQFFVAGHRAGEPWTFQVKDRQHLSTALGELDTLHLAHIPADKSSTTQVDIWLAPKKEWFPVRIRFSEPNGDYIEQSIENISKK